MSCMYAHDLTKLRKCADGRSKIKIKDQHKLKIIIIAVTLAENVIESSGYHKNAEQIIYYNFCIWT